MLSVLQEIVIDKIENLIKEHSLKLMAKYSYFKKCIEDTTF